VMDGGKIVVAKDGWNRLPEKLLRDLPKENLHLNSTVETIADAPGGGQTLSIVGKDGKSKAVHADIVFNSADTNVALKMKKSSPELEAMLKANSYTSTIAVHLVTDTPSQDIFGARTPALTAESGLLQKVGGITFQTGLRGENLGGYEIPGIFLQTEPAKELIQRSVAESWTDERMKKEVMALILPDLKSLSAKDDSGAIQKLVGSLEKGEIVSVKAWDQALPEFQKNYLGLIKKYEDSLTKEWQEFVSGRSKNPPSYFYIGQARFGRTIANTITQTSHEVEKFAGMVKRKPEAFAAPGFPGASAMGCPAAYKLAE
jgi:protoporphyrinogen oxidase